MKTTLELPIEVEVEFAVYNGKPTDLAYLSIPSAAEVFEKFEDEIREACWEAVKEE